MMCSVKIPIHMGNDKKLRIEIPEDIAAEVMFISDRTCCKCRERGKTLQIHHVDEDRNNNEIVNLAVLCLECHNETQIVGGFGRKLNRHQVIKYRDDWISRVKIRRNRADEIASHVMAKTITNLSRVSDSESFSPPIAFINSLPALKASALQRAREGWDTGITSAMKQANYDYLDVLEAILVSLSAYSHQEQFGDQNPRRYFSSLIASKFEWYWEHLGPDEGNTGGTISGVVVGGSVIADIEKKVCETVFALSKKLPDFSYHKWRNAWEGDTN